ncbi:MHYT domain-containing protein [Streptomyces luteolus]|uniref:MHYT domain-containing protein n=1 Tax=Streptomyces luteolus TaxID=3043615 RepID=A0ABT6T5W4_9ACTN|nr:MHYT domain-containing protein [Streptomyces sp. B-S-A12]MDI3423272.1 MHYT domain-containing protein [Streptomyces sp. B-S-A12]
MGHMHHMDGGWITPVLSYVMAVVGAALGLRCTVRALAAGGRAKRNWLITASAAIGAGIWTMHFIAMLGYKVEGTPIRYDIPLTLLSLVVAIAVVGAGVFIAGYGGSRARSVLLGGLGTGLGVAAMHYIGMAAVELNGSLTYDPTLVAASVVIAVVAASAALWAALAVRGPMVAAAAALVMGLAVSSMHYTGMAAVSVSVRASTEPLTGASAPAFILPLAVVLGSFLFLTCAFVALSPTARESAENAAAARPLHEVELPAT